jgi:hypothetical protein
MLLRMLRLAPYDGSPPPPPVLEYGHSTDLSEPPPPPPLSVRLLYVVLSLPAAASPFLPFTHDIAPVDVWGGFLANPGSPDGEFLLLATPFFVSLPLVVWQLRRLGRPRAAERVVMYVIAVACAALTTYFLTRLLMEGNITAREAVEVMPGPAVLAAGATLALWLRRRGRYDDAATAALAAAYSANAVMLFIPMYSPDSPGWWVTLVAVMCLAVLAAVDMARLRGRR